MSTKRKRGRRSGPSPLWMPEPAPAQPIREWVESSVIITTGGRPGYARAYNHQWFGFHARALPPVRLPGLRTG